MARFSIGWRQCFLVLALAFATGAVGASDRLLVLAAASLQGSIDEIARRFQERNGVKVTVSFAASSTLARQIERGAPADLYVSASPLWMDVLEKAQLLRKETRSDLLGNRLVLVAPAGRDHGIRIEPRFPLASLLGGQRLAMGDPGHVPAGIYAKAALETLGIWDTVADRIAGTSNVRASLALVARGEVPYGIVYRSDAIAEPQVAVAGVFPEETHPPIIYPVALPAGSDHPRAGEFLAFLRSPEARRIFESNGFTVLGE